MKEHTRKKQHIMSAASAKKSTGQPDLHRKKVSFDIPRSLFARVEAAASELHLKDTSTFLRQAIERFLIDLQKENLQRELEEGYLANAMLGDQTMKDFEFVDAE
ncbi:MAG: hypothetical protein M3Y72_13115 [Acidobacteriota bacterium]|nr:hypothetical protein [Acidobacteriota bacterium]